MVQPDYRIPAPGLYASTGFVNYAAQSNIGVRLNPPDVTEVVRIARDEIMTNLGSLLLHAPGEGRGRKDTVYQPLRNLEDKTTFDTIHVPRAYIDIAAREKKVATLALKGVEPTSENLAEALYHAAAKWRDPESSKFQIDSWFAVMIGGALGLASRIALTFITERPTTLVNYGVAFLGGAAAGGVVMPLLRAARAHYDLPVVQRLTPIPVYSRIEPK